MAFPERLQLNAWAGGETGLSARIGGRAGSWAVTSRLHRMDRYLLALEEANPRDWHSPRVGWGLILADADELSDADRASGADAPEPLRQLLAERAGSPVLRYRPNKYTSLRRYFPDRPSRDLDLAASEFGIGDDRIPRYLLIYGSPTLIPWDLQYALNARYAVGRLDLAGKPLANYVGALRSGWATMSASPFRTLVWATDHATGDMSGIMKRTIAKPIVAALQGDADLGPGSRYLSREGEGATSSTLRDTLVAHRPGLIVSTSHGKSGDGAVPTTAQDLGLPVGEDLELVRSDDLLANWQPDGAIWYAHACSSAGSSADSVFGGLFEADSEVGTMLASVAALGSAVAPLPQALLGHERPLRAFIGHVEPTFDWTIANPDSGQSLAGGVRAGVYDGLYQRDPYPVGLAFRSYFEPIGVLASEQETLRRAHDRGEDVADAALATQLSARDRMSTVILGDPTVAFDLTGAKDH